MKAKRFFALLLCAMMIISFVGCDKDTYEKANELMANGQYEEALEQFNTIPNFEDSSAKAAECEQNIAYNDAAALFDGGKYEEAIDAFAALGDFKDSKEKHDESVYQLAMAKFDEEDYEAARGYLSEIPEYIADNDEAKEKLVTCSRKILKQYILENGVPFNKLGKEFTGVTTMLDADATYIKKDYTNDRGEAYSLLACAEEGNEAMKIIYFSTRKEKQSAGNVTYVSTADMPLESGSFPGVYGVFLCYLESDKIVGMVGSFYNTTEDGSDMFDIATANKDSTWTYGGLFAGLEGTDVESLTAATTDNMQYIFKNADDLIADSGVTLKDIGFASV